MPVQAEYLTCMHRAETHYRFCPFLYYSDPVFFLINLFCLSFSEFLSFIVIEISKYIYYIEPAFINLPERNRLWTSEIRSISSGENFPDWRQLTGILLPIMAYQSLNSAFFMKPGFQVLPHRNRSPNCGLLPNRLSTRPAGNWFQKDGSEWKSQKKTAGCRRFT